MIIQVLRSGAWFETTIGSIRKGDVFRVVSEERTAGNMSENPIGSDTFKALSDAVVGDGGVIHVTIDKPIQPKFGRGYLSRLRESGLHIEVKGSSTATGWTGDFRNV